MIGGFFDRYYADWGDEDLDWFEDLLEQDDAEIMAWALGTQEAPERFHGALLDQMRRLDYVVI